MCNKAQLIFIQNSIRKNWARKKNETKTIFLETEVNCNFGPVTIMRDAGFGYLHHISASAANATAQNLVNFQAVKKGDTN